MTTHGTAHQTISYLTRRFAEVGLRPGTRHGQNFLIDLNLQRLIVERAELEPRDVVLEVGTGTGALTALMAERAGDVVTVEIDPRLFQLAAEELDGLANVVMLNCDALRNKSHLNPRVVEAVEARLAAGPDRRVKLVANLPYSVATPLVANMLASSIVPHAMTVTVQKEVADRMAALPGSKDYGALSVWIQSQSTVEMVRTLPPSVFWPRPQVTSAIVHIEFDAARRARIGEIEFFHDFTRALFFHRRKYFRSVLTSALKGQLDKPDVDQLLADSGLLPEGRAEQLSIEQIITLARLAQKAIAARAPA